MQRGTVIKNNDFGEIFSSVLSTMLHKRQMSLMQLSTASAIIQNKNNFLPCQSPFQQRGKKELKKKRVAVTSRDFYIYVHSSVSPSNSSKVFFILPRICRELHLLQKKWKDVFVIMY